MDFTGSERLMVGDVSKMAQRRFSPMDGAEMVQRWFRVAWFRDSVEILQKWFMDSLQKIPVIV
jgi:hypothetical protein